MSATDLVAAYAAVVATAAFLWQVYAFRAERNDQVQGRHGHLSVSVWGGVVTLVNTSDFEIHISSFEVYLALARSFSLRRNAFTEGSVESVLQGVGGDKVIPAVLQPHNSADVVIAPARLESAAAALRSMQQDQGLLDHFLQVQVTVRTRTGLYAMAQARYSPPQPGTSILK